MKKFTIKDEKAIREFANGCWYGQMEYIGKNLHDYWLDILDKNHKTHRGVAKPIQMLNRATKLLNELDSIMTVMLRDAVYVKVDDDADDEECNRAWTEAMWKKYQDKLMCEPAQMAVELLDDSPEYKIDRVDLEWLTQPEGLLHDYFKGN